MPIIATSGKKQITDRNDVLTFGKYKGQTVGKVIEAEPSYILWLYENNAIECSGELLDEAAERTEENNQDETWWSWGWDGFEGD